MVKGFGYRDLGCACWCYGGCEEANLRAYKGISERKKGVQDGSRVHLLGSFKQGLLGIVTRLPLFCPDSLYYNPHDRDWPKKKPLMLIPHEV